MSLAWKIDCKVTLAQQYALQIAFMVRFIERDVWSVLLCDAQHGSVMAVLQFLSVQQDLNIRVILMGFVLQDSIPSAGKRAYHNIAGIADAIFPSAMSLC